MKKLYAILLGAGLLAAWPVRGEEPWTLEEAVSYALQNSPDARLAEHRIASARAGLARANAAFWPRLGVESGYTRSDNPARVFGMVLNQRSFSPALDFNNVPDADNLNVRGVLSVPIYNGGRNRAGQRSARARAEAARQSGEAVRNLLAFEVTQTFHTVLKMREFIRAAEAAVKAFENNLLIAGNRWEAGTILRTEVLDVEVRLAQAREDEVRARHATALAQRALRNLLGLEEGEFTIADSAPSVPAPSDGTPFTRAELAAVRALQAAAEADVRQARSGYLPQVDAFGSVDYDRGWRLDGDGASYTAGVVARWNLWDGRLTRAKASQARAELDSAREEERKLRLAIEFEVEKARLNLREADERLGVTAKMVELAAESVELTRAQFEQGTALAAQLIDAETALTAARVRRAEAEADQRLAIAAARKALGLPQVPNQSTRHP